jgi:hypothetical protein
MAVGTFDPPARELVVDPQLLSALASHCYRHVLPLNVKVEGMLAGIRHDIPYFLIAYAPAESIQGI